MIASTRAQNFLASRSTIALARRITHGGRGGFLIEVPPADVDARTSKKRRHLAQEAPKNPNELADLEAASATTRAALR